MNGRNVAFVGVALLVTVPCACLQRNPDFVGASDGGTVAGTGDSGSEPGTSASSQPMDASSAVPGGDEAGTSGGTLGCAPNLDSLRLTVFAENCTSHGCHAGQAPAAALDLVRVDLHQDLLDIPSSTCVGWSRVVAESPEESLLYAKVAGLSTCEVARSFPHDALRSDELECLGGWIESIADCERCGGTRCIDLESDPANCGGCDVPCPAGAGCVSGRCVCPDGGMVCNGACVDPQTDALNCGGCGRDCLGNACNGGECECVGLTSCDGCVDIQSDSAHCGGCDQPCGFGYVCEGGACGCDPTPVSFLAELQPLFTSSCVSNNCHGGNDPKGNLHLGEGSAWANLVGVPAEQCDDDRLRVAPGDSVNSYLMHKLLDMQLCAGDPMPIVPGPGDDTLPDEDLHRISAWICQGALDN